MILIAPLPINFIRRFYDFSKPKQAVSQGTYEDASGEEITGKRSMGKYDDPGGYDSCDFYDCGKSGGCFCRRSIDGHLDWKRMPYGNRCDPAAVLQTSQSN